MPKPSAPPAPPTTATAGTTAEEGNTASTGTAGSVTPDEPGAAAEQQKAGEQVPTGQTAGRPADDLAVKDMNWTELQELVARHKGKIVVVDIWSTSCEPCLRELPYLVTLQKRHPEQVVCISFDCDYDGRKNRPVDYWRERVVQNLKKVQAESIVNVMCTVAADELFQQIELDSIPAVCVYDRTGKLSKRFDNTTPVSATEEGISYEKQIDPLVAELVKAEEN